MMTKYPERPNFIGLAVEQASGETVIEMYNMRTIAAMAYNVDTDTIRLGFADGSFINRKDGHSIYEFLVNMGYVVTLEKKGD